MSTLPCWLQETWLQQGLARQDPEKKRQEQEMSLADIRAMQKQKFKAWLVDLGCTSFEPGYCQKRLNA